MEDNKSKISKKNNLSIVDFGEVLQITKDLVSDTNNVFAKNWTMINSITFDSQNLSRWVIGSISNLLVFAERPKRLRIKLREDEVHSTLKLVSIDNSLLNISTKELNNTYIDHCLCHNSHIYIIEEHDCYKEVFTLMSFDFTGHKRTHLKNTYPKYNYDYSEISTIYSYGKYLLLAVDYDNRHTDEYNTFIHLYNLKDLSYVRTLNIKEIDDGASFGYEECEFISDYIFSCQNIHVGFDGIVLKQSISTGKYSLIEICKDQLIYISIVTFEHILIFSSSSIFVLNGITEKSFLKRSFDEVIVTRTLSACKKYLILAFKNKSVKVLNSVTLLEISEFYHDCVDNYISSVKIVNHLICIGDSKCYKIYQ